MAPPKVATLGELTTVISTFLTGALTLVGIASIVMILVAGFNFLSAGGDKEAAARSRNTLTYAVLGLVLAVSAWIIIIIIYQFLGLPGPGPLNLCIRGSGINCN